MRAFLAFMQPTQLPWEAAFFDWFGGQASEERALAGSRRKRYCGEPFKAWQEALYQHEPERPERLQHSYFQSQGPVHMVIDQVEADWAAIAERDDWAPLKATLQRIAAAREAYGLSDGRAGFLPSA